MVSSHNLELAKFVLFIKNRAPAKVFISSTRSEVNTPLLIGCFLSLEERITQHSISRRKSGHFTSGDINRK